MNKFRKNIVVEFGYATNFTGQTVGEFIEYLKTFDPENWVEFEPCTEYDSPSCSFKVFRKETDCEYSKRQDMEKARFLQNEQAEIKRSLEILAKHGITFLGNKP